MFALFVKLAVVLALLYLQNILTVDNASADDTDEKALWLWETVKFMETVIDEYGGLIGTLCLNGLNILYINLTIVNLIIFLFKYVPTTLFMCRYIKYYYISRWEQFQRKQQEFEDIKLQVKVATTKQSVREAEYKEGSEQLRRGLQRLRGLRTRVRQVLAEDEDLRRAADTNALFGDPDAQRAYNPEQEQKILIELMKDLKIERTKLSEVETENTFGEYGEFVPAEPSSPEASIYSSASESQKECQVKIVKVTNVYKVSYLRHFIKQKRLRRASKQALLKRKMEDIKKLLEDWQKTLNMVINSKLAIVDIDTNHMELASQEAMGDFSKPHLRESSDSDSEISWYPNAFRNPPYCFQDSADMDMSHEYYEPGEVCGGEMSLAPAGMECEWGRPRPANNLFVVTEETSSQLAIQEVKSEAGDDWDCNDITSL